MQTEDKQQAKPERHFHLASTRAGTDEVNVALLGTTKEVTEKVSSALQIALRQSKREIGKLAELGYAPRLGAAYLRWWYLDKLDDQIDADLFDHELFKMGTNMDSLVEAIEDTLADLGTIQVTEDVTLTVHFCEEQCEELTRAQATPLVEDGQGCPDEPHTHQFGPNAFALSVPKTGRPVNLADLMEASGAGIARLLADAGIQVAEKGTAQE
jgi:hypothetical protein